MSILKKNCTVDCINPENDFINPITGEVINFDPELQVIKNKKQLYVQKNKIDIIKNPFSWANIPNIRELLAEKSITLTTLGSVLVLASSLKEDGYLHKQRRVNDYLTRSEIQKKLKFKDGTFKRVLKEAQASGLLIVEGESQKKQIFRLNADYHFYGEAGRNAPKLVRVQKHGFNRLFNDNKTELDQIGFLYLLIPFMNYENCTLVRDITKPADFNNALSVNELSKELGMTRQTINKYLRIEFCYKLRNGYYRMPVVCLSRRPREKKEVITLNPVLFRRRIGFFANIAYHELEESFKCVSVKLT